MSKSKQPIKKIAGMIQTECERAEIACAAVLKDRNGEMNVTISNSGKEMRMMPDVAYMVGGLIAAACNAGSFELGDLPAFLEYAKSVAAVLIGSESIGGALKLIQKPKVVLEGRQRTQKKTDALDGMAESLKKIGECAGTENSAAVSS